MQIQVLHTPVGSLTQGNLTSTTILLLRGFQIAYGLNGEISILDMIIVHPASEPAPVGFWDTIEVQAGEATGTTILGKEPLFGDFLAGEALFGGPEAELVLTTGGTIFAGHVTRIERKPFRMGDTNTAYVEYAIQVQDWTVLLDRTTISSETFTNISDDVVLDSLFTTYLPEIDTTYISFVSQVTLELNNVTLRSSLQRVLEQTQGLAFVDPHKNLIYYAPSERIAPFSLSETPDNSTSYGFELASFSHLSDFSRAANFVQVLGRFLTGSIRAGAIAQDTISQSKYGVLKRTIIDERIFTNAEAQAVANTHLVANANPVVNGEVTFWEDGVTIGDLITVNAPTYGVSGDFRIRRLALTWENKARTVYRASFGEYRPDVIKSLQELAQFIIARSDPLVAGAHADESIDNSNLDPSIEVDLTSSDGANRIRISGDLGVEQSTTGSPSDVVSILNGTVKINGVEVVAGPSGSSTNYGDPISATALSGATVDVDIPAGYAAFKVIVTGVTVSNDDVSVQVQFKHAVLITSGYYRATLGVVSSGTAGNDSAENSSAIELNRNGSNFGLGNAAGESFNAVLALLDPYNTNESPTLEYHTYLKTPAGSGRVATYIGAAGNSTAGAITQLRFLLSAGTFSSGTVYLYGIESP